MIRGKDKMDVEVTFGDPAGGPADPAAVVPEDAAEGGLERGQVPPNGPAAKAGLKAGDIITAVDDKQVKTRADLDRAVATRRSATR